jgi:hypothetical protein
LFGFHDWPARIHIGRTAQHTTIALGIQEAMTLWRVIGIEQISTGEDLVTLKARSNLGVLPNLSESEIPEVLKRAGRVFCRLSTRLSIPRIGPAPSR